MKTPLTAVRLVVAFLPFAFLSCAIWTQGPSTGGPSVTTPVTLNPGEEFTFSLRLKRPVAQELRVHFSHVDFGGTRIECRIGDVELLPYVAFGEDTRYDNVRSVPSMNPPIAEIEGDWLIPARWLQAGKNVVTLTNAGPGTAVMDTLIVGEARPYDPPRFHNSTYLDFDVWGMGYVYPEGSDHKRDSFLLGILNGAGMPSVYFGNDPDSPTGAWGDKRRAEDLVLNWGYDDIEFYTIWYLARRSKRWVTYTDVDGDTSTTGRFSEQSVNPEEIPKGADIFETDVDSVKHILRYNVRYSYPYATHYNFTCEQLWPRNVGIYGDENLWADYGYPARYWAEEHRRLMEGLHDLAHRYNPKGRVASINFWRDTIRREVYDTVRERDQRMADSIDQITTHFTDYRYARGMRFYDYMPDGRLLYQTDIDDKGWPTEHHPEVKPELQYPGGKFPFRTTWQHIQRIPEIAIDFNRYRLGRTEKDMVLGDPAVNRWSNGRPFRYDVGFDGDEAMYNSETVAHDRHYTDRLPWQYLYAFFSHCLLPSAASESHAFRFTYTDSLFGERHDTMNQYGEWVEGAAHSKRFRTRDPLYGDLFGWTGFEYCNKGDYIWQTGIKEAHHRRPPYDAYQLVRRTMYAFVTTGRVFPARLNDPDGKELIVKSLVTRFDGHDLLGLYAVNLDTEPHRLDVSLPLDGPVDEVSLLVFDDRAWDWTVGKRVTVPLKEGVLRYVQEIPPNACWSVFIEPPEGHTYASLDVLPAPQCVSPVEEDHVPSEAPTLEWRGPEGGPYSYVVELAREGRFAEEDRLTLIKGIEGTRYMVDHPLPEQSRVWWRVRAVDSKSGRSSQWSEPAVFAYAWPEYAEWVATWKTPKKDVKEPAPPPAWKTLFNQGGFASPDNLADHGHVMGERNFWLAPARAADQNGVSYWTNTGPPMTEVGWQREAGLPAWWGVRFWKTETFDRVAILWQEERLGTDFVLQAWDGSAWRDLARAEANADTLCSFRLKEPVTTDLFRIWITGAVREDGEVGIREVGIWREPER